ncbi:hypothetical protein BGW38_007915 [Lunasporangiospora selenospora]|uniref:Uncharacterized protein n=1 Tax=Lunasporangiospora selenospora TaxID=979761 RepID=A0A9P6FK40_9FUNG|nr:hypothetical protein BGW38_007915 [Lunasporangiospora selenospora]
MAQHIDCPSPSAPSSPSACCSACCSSSENASPSSPNKSVQFSRFIKISFTYPGDEYDRSALEPAKLTSTELSELVQLRVHWREEMNDRLQQALSEGLIGHEDLVVNLNDSTSRVPHRSTNSSRHHRQRQHHGRHSLLQPSASTTDGIPATATCLKAGTSQTCLAQQMSPPCSPVLSHHDSSCSSSDEDDFDYALGSSSAFSLQAQPTHRLQRFASAGHDGMMHRHAHLERSKENVQCIA